MQDRFVGTRHASSDVSDNAGVVPASVFGTWTTAWAGFETFTLLPIYPIIVVLLAACGAQATPTPSSLPTAGAKLLATVYISPTPNDAEQQATRFAALQTPTAEPVIPTATPTPYVGVFLGAADEAEDGPLPTVALLVRAEDASPTAPNAILEACPRAPDEVFGTLWLTDPNATATIGCPTGDTVTYSGSAQIFERGVMYFNAEGAIWAVTAGGGRFWYVTQPPPADESPISAPEGLRVPQFGFGAVWRGIEGVRDALGFARTDEQSATFTVQGMQGGLLLFDTSAGQVFVLLGNGAQGTAFGPY
jgi:hypothetical protein